MPDTRTSQTSTEAAYASILENISSIAGSCSNKLSRTLIPEYREKRSHVILSFETTVIQSDGLSRPYSTGPIPLNGWELQTAPFFLSDPIKDVPGAVLLRRYNDTADLINESFYQDCLAALPTFVLPLTTLYRLRDELTGILVYTAKRA